MIRKAYIPLLLVSFLLLLTACEQRELCFDHWEHADKYDINVGIDWQLKWEYQYSGGPDWEANWPESLFGFPYASLNPKKPTGVRCIVYSGDDHSESTNIGPDGGTIYLREGKSSLLFFNNNTEFILFDKVSNSSTAIATTRTRSRSTYFGSPFSRDEEETTVNPPDFLFGHYIADYDATLSREMPSIGFTMKPLVFTYLIRVTFAHGLDYVAVARGALSGMAASVYLTDGHTGSEQATVLFDFDIKDYGVEIPVNSFGAPDYPNPEYSRSDKQYGLNVEVRLKNGKILSFDFDVTSQLEKQPRGGVIEVGGIEIPDDIGQEDSGAFGVDVNGWNEYEDVTIVIPSGNSN